MERKVEDTLQTTKPTISTKEPPGSFPSGLASSCQESNNLRLHTSRVLYILRSSLATCFASVIVIN